MCTGWIVGIKTSKDSEENIKVLENKIKSIEQSFNDKYIGKKEVSDANKNEEFKIKYENTFKKRKVIKWFVLSKTFEKLVIYF